MTIKLTRMWGGYKRGHIFETMHLGQQLTLVQRGYAKLIGEIPKPRKAKSRPAKPIPQNNSAPEAKPDHDQTENSPNQRTGDSTGERRGRKKTTGNSQ